MKTKQATITLLLGGLLVLAFAGPSSVQARPKWDVCIERMNSKGERIPRYNNSRLRNGDGDWCWGHGNNHRRWCRGD